MILFFVVNVLALSFSIVYVWKTRRDVREEIRICRRWQDGCCQMYDTMAKVIDTQRNAIKGWQHKIDIMDRDIRKLKKELSEQKE